MQGRFILNNRDINKAVADYSHFLICYNISLSATNDRGNAGRRTDRGKDYKFQEWADVMQFPDPERNFIYTGR